MTERYTDINARTIDDWVAGGWEWGKPISHEDYLRAKRGDWQMLLSPTRPVPKEWYPELSGCRVLGLASGGAQQMPVFAALGAECTVLDYSSAQLKSEEETARREGYSIRIVRHDMTQPLPFEEGGLRPYFSPRQQLLYRKGGARLERVLPRAASRRHPDGGAGYRPQLHV